MKVVAQFGQIHYTGVILKDFSPEGSCAHRHNCREGASAPRWILRKLRMTPSWEQKFKLSHYPIEGDVAQLKPLRVK